MLTGNHQIPIALEAAILADEREASVRREARAEREGEQEERWSRLKNPPPVASTVQSWRDQWWGALRDAGHPVGDRLLGK